jgi:hypothetical protein
MYRQLVTSDQYIIDRAALRHGRALCGCLRSVVRRALSHEGQAVFRSALLRVLNAVEAAATAGVEVPEDVELHASA